MSCGCADRATARLIGRRRYMTDKRLEQSSRAIEDRLAERRAQLERDIPGITAFVQQLREAGLTVAGVRRNEFDGVYVKPLLVSPPPKDLMLWRKGAKGKKDRKRHGAD